MPSPRQVFDENIRPAMLLSRIYCLLENSPPEDEDALLKAVRGLVQGSEPHLYIANKILDQTKFMYLDIKKGIHITAALLGVQEPWKEIAQRLGREAKELKSTLVTTSERRNDIVHRADHLVEALD